MVIDDRVRADLKLAPARVGEDEYVLSLGDLLGIVRKRLFLIVLVTVLLLGLSVGWTLTQTPIYESSVILLVGQKGEVVPESLGSNVDALSQLADTLAALVDSKPIAELVVQRSDLGISSENLLENLRSEHWANTQLIEINYRDSSPERAQRMANTVGDVFADRISELSPNASGVTITVWERATVPNDPVSPNLKLNIALALLMGATLGAGLAFLLEYLEVSRHSSRVEEKPRPARK